MNISIRLLVALTLCVAASHASAQINVQLNGSSGAFPVANDDLLEGISATVTAGSLNGQEGTSNDPAILTNGLFGAGGNPLDTAQTVSIGNNTTLTYQLDTVASPGGYDITGINVYSGWRDAGRDRQDYEALYSTVSDPGTFLSITSVSGFNPSPSNSGESIITDGSGIIASEVAALQFNFPGQENGYVGYREIDVFGSAATAVPEPASIAIWSLIGLGLSGFGYWRVRRKK